MDTISSRVRRIALLATVGSAIAAATLGAAADASAANAVTASSDAIITAVGGWTEGGGVYSSAEAEGRTGRATVNHRGKAELKTISATTNKRAHGWTTWAGTRHYTTAQLEKTWPSSGVITSSGRQWGTGGTEAISAYRAFNPNATSDGYGQARTYYGR